MASATTGAATAPLAPTGLGAAASGQTQIDLSWTAPSNTGGVAITGYQIEVSSNAGTSWTDLEANTGSTATSYAHTGLAPGTTRHYRVSAINSVGTSPASNVASATTGAATAPLAPTGLGAAASGQTQIVARDGHASGVRRRRPGQVNLGLPRCRCPQTRRSQRSRRCTRRGTGHVRGRTGSDRVNCAHAVMPRCAGSQTGVRVARGGAARIGFQVRPACACI